MASTMERLSSNKVRFTINVAAEKFDEGLNIAYRKLVKRINIPGFRRGKAPMRVIENYYGPSVFYEDALEAVRKLHREAQWYFDFCYVENSEGAHNSELAMNCLDTSEMKIQEGMALLAN